MICLSCLISLNIFTIFVVVFCFEELHVLGGLCDFIFVLIDFFKFISNWLFAALGSKDLKKKRLENI